MGVLANWQSILVQSVPKYTVNTLIQRGKVKDLCNSIMLTCWQIVVILHFLRFVFSFRESWISTAQLQHRCVSKDTWFTTCPSLVTGTDSAWFDTIWCETNPTPSGRFVHFRLIAHYLSNWKFTFRPIAFRMYSLLCPARLVISTSHFLILIAWTCCW